MDKSLEELSKMIFKQSKNFNIADQSLDIRLLNIFWAMDGSRDLKSVAQEGAYDLEKLAADVKNLLRMGALDVSQSEAGFVGKEPLDILSQNLSQAIGPVADILVEDTISDMGYTLSSLPNHKMEELINRLALEIQDANSTQTFKSSVVHLINKTP